MEMHIYLPAADKKELQRIHRVSRVTLWNALNFVHNSPKAKAIRAGALRRGGILIDPYEDGPRPNQITTFETADNTMTQVFSDRVFFVADMKDGSVTIYVDGEPEDRFEDVTMKGLAPIIRQAQQLANKLK